MLQKAINNSKQGLDQGFRVSPIFGLLLPSVCPPPSVTLVIQIIKYLKEKTVAYAYNFYEPKISVSSYTQ